MDLSFERVLTEGLISLRPTRTGYVATIPQALTGLNADASEVLWVNRFDEVPWTFGHDKVLVAGDVIVAGYHRKELDLSRIIGIDARTGEALWHREVKKSVFGVGTHGIAALNERFTVIPQGRDGVVIDNFTGEVARKLNVPRVSSHVAIGDDLYMARHPSSELLCLSTVGPPKKWRVQKIDCGWNVHRIFPDDSNTLWALCSKWTDGRTVPSLIPIRDGKPGSPLEFDRNFYAARIVALPGGKVIISGTEQTVCIDTAGRRELWSNDWGMSSIAPVGDRVLVTYFKVRAADWCDPATGETTALEGSLAKITGAFSMDTERALVRLKDYPSEKQSWAGVVSAKTGHASAAAAPITSAGEPDRTVWDLLGIEPQVADTPREALEKALETAREKDAKALVRAVCKAYRKKKLDRSAAALINDAHAAGWDAVLDLFDYTPTVFELFSMGPRDRLLPALRLPQTDEYAAWLLMDTGAVIFAHEDELSEIAWDFEEHIEDGNVPRFLNAIARRAGYRSLSAYRRENAGGR